MSRSHDEGPTVGTPCVRPNLDELEQTVQALYEFIQTFKALAQRLGLPGRDATFKTLDRAESFLFGRLEVARRLARLLIEDCEPAEKERARREMAALVQQVRRASLWVRLKIFAFDVTLEQILRELQEARDKSRALKPLLPGSGSTD